VPVVLVVSVVPVGSVVPVAGPLLAVSPAMSVAARAVLVRPGVPEGVLVGACSRARALGHEAANRTPIRARVATQRPRLEPGTVRWLCESDGENLPKADPDFPSGRGLVCRSLRPNPSSRLPFPTNSFPPLSDRARRLCRAEILANSDGSPTGPPPRASGRTDGRHVGDGRQAAAPSRHADALANSRLDGDERDRDWGQLRQEGDRDTHVWHHQRWLSRDQHLWRGYQVVCGAIGLLGCDHRHGQDRNEDRNCELQCH
jgi:hypothetical protein